MEDGSRLNPQPRRLDPYRQADAEPEFERDISWATPIEMDAPPYNPIHLFAKNI